MLALTDVLQGLSAPIISGLASVGGTGQDPEGNSMSTGATLGIGLDCLMVDRCCSSCSTHGRKALAGGLGDLDKLIGFEM